MILVMMMMITATTAMSKGSKIPQQEHVMRRQTGLVCELPLTQINRKFALLLIRVLATANETQRNKAIISSFQLCYFFFLGLSNLIRKYHYPRELGYEVVVSINERHKKHTHTHKTETKMKKTQHTNTHTQKRKKKAKTRKR